MAQSPPPPVLQPVRGAARVAVAALLLAGAAWVVRAVWEIRLAVAGEPASGPPDRGDGSHRPLTALEDSYHVVVTAGGVVALICALVFLSWLWRVRDNARVLSGRPARYSDIWVYVGWSVPVMNLWVPRGLVADVYEGSTGGKPAPMILNIWWVLWLVGMVSGVGLLYQDSKDEVVERAYTELWPLLASDAAVVGAAVAAVFVVRAVTAVQLERGAAGAAAPVPAA
ncbi:DUF4328 domain-containing protein [Streptomyces sp. HUAS TT20]|uniref:DUF4328 domain-containing protein n=1 Tax=Streptomyces sp. HUAS TT20 TaxID=3447509 RepID=UPI0021DAE5BC|nr:DUF4328 domain-containing protein [Streptomyces sp. HUAS 15-9]UXY32673.1 DUF4328 domain-containing protein [Streptomyces sp. HUAS 15-9]